MNGLLSELSREFSEGTLGVRETIWGVFGGHFGGICKDFGGKTMQKNSGKNPNLILYHLKLPLNSLFIEKGVNKLAKG